jgi:hypothetical protein
MFLCFTSRELTAPSYFSGQAPPPNISLALQRLIPQVAKDPTPSIEVVWSSAGTPAGRQHVAHCPPS